MIHPANLDDYRHKTGVFTKKVTHGLHEIDLWMGQLIQATKDANIYNDTDFIMVSDHGQLNITRAVAINVMFARNGLIGVNENGEITDWTAFCKSVGLSAQVYLKNPDDTDTLKHTHDFLNWMCEEGVYGISRVYAAKEAQEEEHLAGDFSFVLETDGYTAFHNDWRMPLVRSKVLTDYRYANASHGHHPDKGPQPTMFAFGPDFKPGATIERARLVDIAPTVAKALEINFIKSDGQILEQLFR